MDTIKWIIDKTEQNQFKYLGKFGHRLLFRDTSLCPFTSKLPYIYDMNTMKPSFIQPGQMEMDEYDTYYGRVL